MTRKIKHKNKTIVKEALKEGFYPALQEQAGEIIYDRVKYGNLVFPNDLDSIQPIQKDGNLCIQFPE